MPVSSIAAAATAVEAVSAPAIRAHRTRAADARLRPRAVRRSANRRTFTRAVPLLGALAVVAATTGAAQAGELTFAASSTATASYTSMTQLDAQSDTRVSRDKRSAVSPTDTSAPSADSSSAAPEVALAPAGDASATVVPTPAAADPIPAIVVAVPTVAPTPTNAVAGTWIRPTDGGQETSCFCERWGTFHDGIDIDPPLGTPIYAVGDGTVVFAGPVSGYGIGIYIQHANGDVSFYGHESIYYVHTGDVVTAGEKIALVGNEGYSTGPHLHFGVYQGWASIGKIGTAIDPVPWLADRGIIVGPYNPNG
jgi:murein DD-endopeptidase MepM/ murein hydrolase activator NlpD